MRIVRSGDCARNRLRFLRQAAQKLLEDRADQHGPDHRAGHGTTTVPGLSGSISGPGPGATTRPPHIRSLPATDGSSPRSADTLR